LADRLVITALDRQVAPDRVARYLSGAALAQTVRVAGKEVLWLYETRPQAELEHLARYGAPGDVVLCDAASPFCRGTLVPAAQDAPWQGDLHTIVDRTEPEIVEMLNQWSTQHTRLWYLAYPTATGATGSVPSVPPDLASPVTAAILRRQLEGTATRLDHVDLGDLTATLYILPQEPRFAVGDEAFSPIRYGGQLAVTGAALYDARPAADEGIHFHLRWVAESAPQGDVRVFVHLIDGSDHLRQAGRGQEWLVDGRGWPTSHWDVTGIGGPSVGKDYSLGLPPGLPPGAYQLVLGLADVESKVWLPVVDAEGRIVGGTANLLPVEIGPPSALPDPGALQLAQPLDVAWRSLRLLGYSAPSHAQAGQPVVVQLGWLGIEAGAGRPEQDLRVALSLVGPDGEPVLVETLPLSRYPTSRWRAGEAIHELYDLRLPAELEGGAYTLALAVLDERAQILPLSGTGERATLGTLRVSVQERLFELPQPPQRPLELSLTPAAGSDGPVISLLGYDLVLPAGDSAQDRLSLTLYWRCERAMETSYSVFVHLLDEAGQVRGQRDRLPAAGAAPTTGWIAGQIVADVYEVPLAPDAPGGVYRIEVGMYNARDMVRLQMVDGEGKPLPGDRYVLPEEARLEPAE
jgi:hypothetical protein